MPHINQPKFNFVCFEEFFFTQRPQLSLKLVRQLEKEHCAKQKKVDFRQKQLTFIQRREALKSSNIPFEGVVNYIEERSSNAQQNLMHKTNWSCQRKIGNYLKNFGRSLDSHEECRIGFMYLL